MAAVLLADTRVAGQILFADQQHQDAFFAQHIMIAQVFIAQRQAIHPLRDQRLDTVLNAIGVAVVGEAGGQPIQQPEAFIHLAQQQATPIRRDTSAVESTDHLASTQGVKFQLLGITLCRHRPLSWWSHKVLFALALCAR